MEDSFLIRFRVWDWIRVFFGREEFGLEQKGAWGIDKFDFIRIGLGTPILKFNTSSLQIGRSPKNKGSSSNHDFSGANC